MVFIQAIVIAMGAFIAYVGMSKVPDNYQERKDPEKYRSEKEKGYALFIIGVIIIALALTLL